MKKIYLLISAYLIIGFCANAQINLTNGLIAFYPFTGNAADSSGNVHNGTVNGATLTTDRFGHANSAYSFNGTSNYISIPTTNLIGLNKYTYCLWMKPTTTPTNGGGMAYSIGDNSSGVCQGLTYQPATTIFAGSYNVGSSPTQSYSKSAAMNPNQWIFVVVTRDSSSINMYVNSSLIAYTSNANTNNETANYGSITNANIGGRCNLDGNYFFTGAIDDVRLYNRVLSECEINALYMGNTSTNIKDEPINSSSISVFPNPTNGYATLNFNLNQKSNVIVKIFNMQGQIVYMETQNQNSGEYLTSIDFSKQAKGIYLLQFTTDNYSTTRKIIVE